jgi:Domain of unknown function (DUF4431)
LYGYSNELWKNKLPGFKGVEQRNSIRSAKRGGMRFSSVVFCSTMNKTQRVPMFCALAFLPFAGLVQAQAHTSRKCLDYGPSVNTVAGRITREIFPGPPNYEDVQKGDEPETYWILEPTHAACMNPDSRDGLGSKGLTNVHRIQLIFKNHPEYDKYSALVSQPVIATGTLFEGITGHHHTDVLLFVRELRKANQVQRCDRRRE